MTQTLNVYTL